jgi:hypothetical protein
MFLLGAAAVALPLVLHLIRRSSNQRQPFSSLMFLLPTAPRLTRRSRLEHRLLLALRCLVLGLLAAGFARPFLKRDLPASPAESAGRQRVLLLDTSASMKRDALWREARAKAEAILRQSLPGDQVAVFAFDLQPRTLVSFDQWNQTPVGERVPLALQRLAATTPGWAATHLGRALTTAAEALEITERGAGVSTRQILVISDLQAGSHLDALQSYQWPNGVQVLFEPVQAQHKSNAGLELLAEREDAAPGPAEPGVRVRVHNASDSKREQFQVGWADATAQAFAATPKDVYVPPGQSRGLTFPASGAGVPLPRLMLRGDEEDFDNTVHLARQEPRTVAVLHLANESEHDRTQPGYFLRRAFQETPRQVAQVRLRSPQQCTAADAEHAGLIVVTDPLPEAVAASLRQQLEGGKTALLVLRTNASPATLARLAGADVAGVTEARPPRYALLGEIDFRHPLFAPFADPRFSDFTRIHFWKYRRVEPAALPAARVLARFDGGDPALLEIPVGAGRLVVLTSCWHPEDSQLALSSKFVPLLYSLLELAGGGPSVPSQYRVGDTVAVQMLPFQRATSAVSRAASAGAPQTFDILLPDRTRFSMTTGEPRFDRTHWPGVYEVTSPGGSTQFAVNLDPAESRTAPLSLDELERLGVPVKTEEFRGVIAPDRALALRHAELESRQKLWRWLIVAALLFVGLETWLAGQLAGRPSPPTKAVA